MRKTAQIMLTCCALILVPAMAYKALAQESAGAPAAAKAPEPPAHFYHLEFVIQETGADGKPTNSRTYSGTVSTSRTDHGFSTRTGSRVPIATGTMDNPQNTQFQYIDIGVNIDANGAREEGEKLALSLNAEISSLAGTQNISGVNEPVVRQNRWQASVLIPIGKPTTVFTSDVLDNKGGMQLIVTATPVK
jgi:hypothetical protein